MMTPKLSSFWMRIQGSLFPKLERAFECPLTEEHIWSLPRLQEGGSRQKEGRSVHISGLVMETLCFRASMKHSSTLS